MSNFKKYFWMFFCNLVLGATTAQSYVNSLTSTNSPVHWPSTTSLIDVYVNSSNTQGFSESVVQSQASSSVAQWNGHSKISLRKNSTTASGQEDVNEIYFSRDSSVFNGTGVVGITQVLFKNTNGDILEADVLLNDNFTFSTNIEDSNYLGNVMTHELGHALGLGHSQVIGSTMFYSLNRGQSTLSQDDKAGIYSTYPSGNSSLGSLSGKIVGGQKVVPVFGAHVEAISVKTGEVSGATISNLDGSFTIDGLNQDDQYYIFTSPIVQAGLPNKYANVRSDFCESSRKYRGSFFQSCGSSFEGYPQSVRLNSSQVNIGNISIRCGLDVPVEYLQGKNLTPASFDMLDGVISGVGNAFVGYFSNQEIIQEAVDYFKIDLSGVDLESLSPTGNLYLELKILNQNFYSPFKANIKIKRISGTTDISPQYTQNADGWLNLETITRIPISRGDLSDNDIEIVVTPEALDGINFPADTSYSKEDYFPSYSSFQDSLYFYLVSASIVKENGSSYTQISSKVDQLSDNTQCTDAMNTYALSEYSANRIVGKSTSKKKDNIFGCGTIDLMAGPGSGPGGFFIGLIFSLLLCNLTSSIIKQYKLKQYGKMAQADL